MPTEKTTSSSDVGVAAEDVHLREADDLRDRDERAEHGKPGDDSGRQDHFLPPPVWVVRTLTKSMSRRSANGLQVDALVGLLLLDARAW